MIIDLPQTYGYVIIVATLIALEIPLFGFAIAGRTRGRIFNKEWLVKNFGELHKTEIGTEIDGGGFPDTGSGYYSRKLTYKEWYEMNLAQRVHANFVEFAPSSFVALLLAGLYFPVAAAALGLSLFLLRIVYACGYINWGPIGRLVGFIGYVLCLTALAVLDITTGIKLINGESMK